MLRWEYFVQRGLRVRDLAPRIKVVGGDLVERNGFQTP